MKSKSIRYILPFLFLNFLLIECAPDSEHILNNGIKLHREGHITKALSLIEKGVYNSVTKECFSSVNLINNGGLLYHRNKDKSVIAYPANIDVNIPISCNIMYFDKYQNRIALLDEMRAKIFNRNGALIKDVSLTQGENKTKNEIKAMSLINDRLLYYKSRKIYYYDLRSSDHKQLVKDRFSPPFKRSYYYEVKFYVNKNTLAFVVGAAGSYNVSVINVDNASILLNNHKIASSKLFFQGEYIYYITGSSGKWILRKMSLHNKAKTKLIKFKDLVDIELTSSGIIYEKSDGLCIMAYSNKKPIRLPFKFELAGKCGNEVFVNNTDSYCLIYLQKLFDKIDFLKREIPALFEKK